MAFGSFGGKTQDAGAETVLRERLRKKAFDCNLVGAGLRLIARTRPRPKS